MGEVGIPDFAVKGSQTARTDLQTEGHSTNPEVSFPDKTGHLPDHRAGSSDNSSFSGFPGQQTLETEAHEA